MDVRLATLETEEPGKAEEAEEPKLGVAVILVIPFVQDFHLAGIAGLSNGRSRGEEKSGCHEQDRCAHECAPDETAS
jgi:hypothetical protein